MVLHTQYTALKEQDRPWHPTGDTWIAIAFGLLGVILAAMQVWVSWPRNGTI